MVRSTTLVPQLVSFRGSPRILIFGFLSGSIDGPSYHSGAGLSVSDPTNPRTLF